MGNKNNAVILSSALFAVLAVLSYVSAGTELDLFYAKIVWSLAVASFGFFIFQTGKVSVLRSFLFILIAFFFFLEFRLFRFLNLGAPDTPYCHIALAGTILNFFHNQFLALTSGNWHTWAFLSAGFLWLLMIFTIGQGVCSWVCFFGGIDEGFSRVFKKPVLKFDVSKKWRDFPLAFLIFVVIVSFIEGSPTYCKWVCPLKLTGAFWDKGEAFIRGTQTSVFITVLAVFMIILPVLTKKRTFCSFLCPFGALASSCGKISPYKISIDKEKCTLCQRCREVCPVYAIDEDDLKKHEISFYCNKCLKCVDNCPEGAISVTVSGRTTYAKGLFVFLALMITGVISGLFVPQLFLKIINVMFAHTA